MEERKQEPKLNKEKELQMFVGYADDHAGDLYRLIHIKTEQIILRRDVRWLNIIWKVYMENKED